MAAELSEEQKEAFKEAFDLFDADKDGFVTTKELGTLMRCVGLAPSEEEVEQVIASVGKKKANKIDFAKFCRIVAPRFSNNVTEDEVTSAFRVFDKDGSGFLSKAEIRQVLCSLGEALTEDEVDDMIGRIELESNGSINYAKLAHVMLS